MCSKMDKVIDYIFNIFMTVVIYAALILLGVLSVVTVLVTTSADYAESAYSVTFTKFVPILIGVLSGILILYILRRNERLIPPAHSIEAAGFLYGLTASTLWIFIANAKPVYDSATLIQAAQALLGDSEYQALWMHGGYMWRYSFQTPYVLLIAATIKIAGVNFDILLELINALANAFTFFLLIRIARKLSHSKMVPLIALFLSTCFFATIYYATWEYGNLIGNTLMLASALNLIEAFENKIRINKVGLSVMFMVFACLIKSTLAIAAIALGVVFLLLGLRRRQCGFLSLIVVPYVIYSIMLGAINSYVGTITGCDFSGTIPMMSHVVMGTGGGLEWEAEVTGNEEVVFATEMPGFYNGYVNQLDKDANYYNVANKYYLKKRLKRYEDYPDLFVKFFGKKLLIEWSDPTFGSLIESNWDRDSVDVGASTRRDYTAFARSFYYGKANAVTTMLMDISQSLIAIGAFLEFLTVICTLHGHRKHRVNDFGHNPDPTELLLIVFTIGGFILYIFWEDKSQYIMPFYIAMLPYAASGLASVLDYIYRKICNDSKLENRWASLKNGRHMRIS